MGEAAGGFRRRHRDVALQSAGSYYNETTKEPACVSGSPATLVGFDDLQGSNQSDALFGTGGVNVINGHLGPDSLYGEAGDDEIEAQDEGKDKVGGAKAKTAASSTRNSMKPQAAR